MSVLKASQNILHSRKSDGHWRMVHVPSPKMGTVSSEILVSFASFTSGTMPRLCSSART